MQLMMASGMLSEAELRVWMTSFSTESGALQPVSAAHFVSDRQGSENV